MVCRFADVLTGVKAGGCNLRVHVPSSARPGVVRMGRMHVIEYLSARRGTLPRPQQGDDKR